VAKRIQRKRTKGWRMPKGAVYVGRPGAFGNPFVVSATDDAAAVVARYRDFILGPFGRGPQLLAMARDELRGKDLACWCPLDQPCHADVLLEIANGEDSQ
jgi:hypothetical protein